MLYLNDANTKSLALVLQEAGSAVSIRQTGTGIVVAYCKYGEGVTTVEIDRHGGIKENPWNASTLTT